jgi:hypothetical protein
MDADTGLAATVKDATTRCACGRFGVKESGFCSAECAAEHASASSAPPRVLDDGQAQAAPASQVTSSDDEAATVVARIAAMANGQTPPASAATDPEAEYIRRMIAHDRQIRDEQRRARGSR